MEMTGQLHALTASPSGQNLGIRWTGDCMGPGPSAGVDVFGEVLPFAGILTGS